PQGVVGPNGSTDVVIAGTGSVPTGALASLQNVTSTGALAAGFVTVHPTGTARPLVASTTVPQPSVARGGSVIAPTGVGGAVTYYSNAGTHLVVDVVGYYAG
ncbi:MAG: hypothetical protein KDB21_17780, partial [Acidimicrobiales bacterium]|nr:hypothetical protein [Acidimicrobiales bacterium]